MRSRLWIAALTGSLCLVGGRAALAQQTPRTDLGHTPRLALTVLKAQTHAILTVTSPAFKNGGEIPDENTQYGKNIFPGLAWIAGPAGTRSYVIFIQGESYGSGPTTIQFTLFNVPATITTLTAGMTSPPVGAVYGPNVHGANKPYAGPHTHTGDRHGYHIEVFALDTLLQLPAPVSFDALMSAMSGHVLASGELVAYTAKPADAVYKPNKE
jgi:para-nitrobenzyl esterase